MTTVELVNRHYVPEGPCEIGYWPVLGHHLHELCGFQAATCWLLIHTCSPSDDCGVRVHEDVYAACNHCREVLAV